MPRTKRSAITAVDDQAAQEKNVTLVDVTETVTETPEQSGALEIINAFLYLLDQVEQYGPSHPFSDEGPYELMSLPQHLWPVLLNDQTHGVVNYKREQLKQLTERIQNDVTR